MRSMTRTRLFVAGAFVVGNAPRVSIHLEFVDQNQRIGPLGNGQ